MPFTTVETSNSTTTLLIRTSRTTSSPFTSVKPFRPGWRTARSSHSDSTRALHGRLWEHTRSIRRSKNLKINDFYCRFIILNGVETDLISAVEAQLIRSCRPLWNSVVDGFGNHDPGKGRYNQARSEWDVLHPGREWAERLTGPPPRLDDIIAKIQEIKQQLPFP